MDNDLTQAGFTKMIQNTESKIIMVRSRIKELECELAGMMQWQLVLEEGRKKMIFQAEMKEFELNPKDFLMELKNYGNSTKID